MWSRRTVLALPGSLLAQPGRARLTILHTNDIHGHLEPWLGWEGGLDGRTVGGFDRLAAAVGRIRDEAGAANLLLLDAGDAIGDTMLAGLTQGAAVLEFMNAAGYAAMTIGNHEPDFGMDRLRTLAAQARFPLLAANVLERRTGSLFTRPFEVVAAAGVRVGILGLAYPHTPLTTAAGNVAGFDFRPGIAAAREYVRRVKDAGAAIVVALSHLGLGSDIRLAESVPEIDVIVGGHSHNRMSAARRAGNALIVQSGAHLSDLGRLDLFVENGRIAGHRRELIPLDNAAVPSDAAVRQRLDSLNARHRKELEVLIARAGDPIVRAQTLAGQEPRDRDRESPADSLFADLLRVATGAEIVLLPGVGYGVAIPRGPLTARGLRNLVPHAGKLVAMKLSGAELREVLEQSVENVHTKDPERKLGGIVQVSGLRFRFDPNRPFGSRVVECHAAGAPLDATRIYSVVANGMIAEGGHRYAALARARGRRELGSQYEMLESALRRAGTVSPPPPGRISNR